MNQAVALIRCKKQINPLYVYHMLQAHDIQQQITESTVTSAISNLSLNKIKDLRIPIPSIEDQNKIAMLLEGVRQRRNDLIDYNSLPDYLKDIPLLISKVALLAAKIEEARELRSEAVEELNALKSSYMNYLFSSEKFQRWSSFTLDDIADIRAGVTLGRMLKGPEISVPYLRVANVQDGHLDLSIIKEVNIFPEELEKWRLEDGDILLTEGGDWDKLGRGTVWREEIPNCIHQNHIFRVRITQKDFDVNFLAAYLSSPYGKAYFQSASKKTTNLASINQKQLKAFTVLKPPLDVQKEIVMSLSMLQKNIELLKQQQSQTSAELNALLPSILDKAFKGEL